MLSDISDQERTLVLLELTRRMVLYSSPETYIKKLEKERNKKYETDEDVYTPKPDQENSQGSKKQDLSNKEKSNQESLDKNKLKDMERGNSQKAPKPKPKKVPTRKEPSNKEGSLKAPEPKLPAQFSHLKPDNKNIDLDLGKINPLLKDSAVKVIECPGPNEKIMVKGDMGEKPTNIMVSQEEINEIIETFSDKAGIPVEQGTTQLVLGKFQMTVIKPEGEGNKRFIIKKLPPKKSQGPSGAPMPKKPGPKKTPSSLMPGSEGQGDKTDKGNIMPKK